MQKLHFGGIRRAGFSERESACDPENDCRENWEIGTDGQDSDQNFTGKEAAYPKERETQWLLGSPAINLNGR